jgi:hypothetical protein
MFMCFTASIYIVQSNNFDNLSLKKSIDVGICLLDPFDAQKNRRGVLKHPYAD